MTMRSIKMVTIITWVMSLVVRVISEAVENWSNSALEKLSTLWNTLWRRSRASPAPVVADR